MSETSEIENRAWDWIDENVMPGVLRGNMSLEDAVGRHADHMMVLSGGPSYEAAWKTIHLARERLRDLKDQSVQLSRSFMRRVRFQRGDSTEEQVREAWESMVVATPENVAGTDGTFVATINLDQMLTIFETIGDWLEGEEVQWCSAHNSKWEDFGAIDTGCGWGNPLKPCVLASGTVRLIRK